MKISVVTVCYNAVDQIEETIKSVVGQTYQNIEYIVIDGGSTDGTTDIIRKYSDKISYWISEPDNGIYDAMNKGIHVATGDYINFMNAGDYFSSASAISDVVKQINATNDIIYGDSTMIDYKGRRRFSAADTDVNLLKKRPIYRHNASFTRTSLHRKNLFALDKKKNFKYALDYNNIFTLWHQGARFQKVDVDVVTWDKKGTSDRDVENVRLMFAISHQFRKSSLKDHVIYIYDLIKAYRRDILKKFDCI